MIERRAPFALDEAKFGTQKIVTYVLLLIFAAVVTSVFLGSDQAERSTVLQTVINLVVMAVGYWIGSSKGGQESALAASRIAEATAVKGKTIPAEDVKVNAAGDVTVQSTDRKDTDEPQK